MLHTDAQFSEAVEKAVAAMEQDTDAEVVVVAARRSASYQATSLFVAGIGGVLGLLLVLYAPVVVPPWAVPLDTLVLAAMGYALGRTDHVLRVFTPASVMRREVRRAAHEEFLREAVHATPQRSGILVYVSALEGRVELLADVGIRGQIPRADWERVCRGQRGNSTAQVLAGLDALAPVLAHAVPHVDHADRVSLPDAPRIRP